MIEFFFGGTGKGHYKPEGREFTPIEQKMIHKVVLVFFEDMEEAWKPIYPVKPTYVRSEMNPQFVTIVTPVDVVIKVEFILEIEGKQCRVFLCIPYGTVEPIKDRLYSAFSADRDEMDVKWLERLNRALTEIPVHVTGILGKTMVNVDYLLKLRENDLIILDKRVEQNVDILIENTPKFLAKLGTYKGVYSLKVVKAL
jgi:flagellar motor switch protein FliM